MEYQYREKAWTFWNSGQPLEAGRVLYENLRQEQRPLWAAEVLEICLDLITLVPEIQSVYEIAKNPTRWKEAHSAFSAVRKLTLQMERHSNKDPIYSGVLHLAENTAKVAYNASGEPAPFDHNAGWRIVSNLRYLVGQIKDPEFESEAWSVVSGENHLEKRRETT